MLKILFIYILLIVSLYAEKPDLLLLNKYSDDINVSSWYMSEKLDGVRAYWDGEKLISRGGKVFAAPKFFTKDFPKTELDGELWSKRGDFSNVSSIVNTSSRHSQLNWESRWQTLTYNIFEVPNATGNLIQRISNVKETKYIKIIKQIQVKNKKHLHNYLKDIEKKGGEGVVVRDGSLSYYSGRNNNALKVKSYTDEECEVVGYNAGEGKYKNMLGSIECKMSNNKTLKIGTGLKDEQRRTPPEIGAIITFKYYGLTSKGNPRFPVFLRVRK